MLVVTRKVGERIVIGSGRSDSLDNSPLVL